MKAETIRIFLGGKPIITITRRPLMTQKPMSEFMADRKIDK